jgi:hypothetical protein
MRGFTTGTTYKEFKVLLDKDLNLHKSGIKESKFCGFLRLENFKIETP